MCGQQKLVRANLRIFIQKMFHSVIPHRPIFFPAVLASQTHGDLATFRVTTLQALKVRNSSWHFYPYCVSHVIRILASLLSVQYKNQCIFYKKMFTMI